MATLFDDDKIINKSLKKSTSIDLNTNNKPTKDNLNDDINSYTFETPMMIQYQKLKNVHNDCLLFFRLGDFYEMFMHDALLASKILDITLTKRSRGKDGVIPMAGIPFHAVESYLNKLVKNGHKVAIAEQVGDVNGKELVTREVVRIVTPGTILSDTSLDKKENNYIISLFLDNKHFGLALSDLSTGNFYTEQYDMAELKNIIENELVKYNPTECILPKSLYDDPTFLKLFSIHKDLNIYPFYDFNSYVENYSDNLKSHFKIKSLSSFNLNNKKHAAKASSALLGYLKHTQKSNISHVKNISSIKSSDYVKLNRATITNLELFNTLKEQSKKGTLLNYLDKTSTAMGARLLRNWLIRPLTNKNILQKRYDSISYYLENKQIKNKSFDLLENISDIERTLSKVSLNSANTRDINNLADSLLTAVELIKINKNLPYFLIKSAKSANGGNSANSSNADNSANSANGVNSAQSANFETNSKTAPNTYQDIIDLVNTIGSTLVLEPSLDIKNGGFIKKGISDELDNLNKTIFNSKNYITQLEKSEREKTNISSLKIRFNKVFGYYIEVTKSNLSLVPKHYIRKQTMVNAERFITDDLKKHEEIILSNEAVANEIEYNLFLELCNKISSCTNSIQSLANDVAKIDCLISFSNLSNEYNLVKPVIKNNKKIIIKKNRHAVVESILDFKDFVSNDVYLDNDKNQLLIITGPNMAGKSVYLRQVAITMIMAQIGCFVSAESAEISLVDNIFVRSGASDIITAGLSTFMVEMVETANILADATSDSLVIMDEIGRGTSTYDGISIAWSIAEYLVSHGEHRPKTLFATHYHELTDLENKYDSIKNYHFPATEYNGEPVFLHTLKVGGASSSFGIQVAKIAGLPKKVYENAQHILDDLQKSKNSNIKVHKNGNNLEVNKSDDIINVSDSTKSINANKTNDTLNVSKIDKIDKNLIEKIKKIDINNLTPIDALLKLKEIKDLT